MDRYYHFDGEEPQSGTAATSFKLQPHRQNLNRSSRWRRRSCPSRTKTRPWSTYLLACITGIPNKMGNDLEREMVSELLMHLGINVHVAQSSSQKMYDTLRRGGLASWGRRGQSDGVTSVRTTRPTCHVAGLSATRSTCSQPFPFHLQHTSPHKPSYRILTIIERPQIILPSLLL